MIRDNDVDLDLMLTTLVGQAGVAGIKVVNGGIGSPFRRESGLIWHWTGEAGTESSFIVLAQHVGAKIIYRLRVVLDLDDLLRTELAEKYLADFEENDNPPTYQKLKRSVKAWERYDGQPYGIQLVFVHEGVQLELFVGSRWFEDLSNQLSTTLDELAESEALQGDAVWQRQRAEVRERATLLANNEQYGRAKNEGQRAHVAEDLFPDIEPNEIGDIVETASYIYWADVEPRREREMALQARELLDDGGTTTSISAVLGVSKDRVGRLLYMDLD